MKKSVFSMMILMLAGLTQITIGVDYSIYDLQYQSDPEDLNSPYVGEDVNCIGGIVIHKFPGSKPKVTLYDPTYSAGWGGIAIKDFTAAKNFYTTVNIGDWVALTHTTVEEYNGNTQLRFEDISGFVVESSGNALPEPILIEPNDIKSPIYQTSPEGWLVQNHNAEKYEAMLVKVENVIVTEKDNGKASDNYTLQSIAHPNDPNFSCWASDYMNEEVEDNGYHRFVNLGSRFCSVTGIIEQYDGYKISYEWDYYQLLTTRTGDLKRYTPADLDGDCMVDFSDFAVFSQYWLWGTE
jgi:predicted extracellular nuclease